MLELSGGVNIFVGENGVGKTNLLEAIYMTCIGRGFKTPRDREVIKFGKDFAKIKTIACKKFGDISIEISINTTAKQIKINEIPISKMGELMGNVACVFFSPDELKLVKESPQDRRRFMDIDISQIDKAYFYNLLRYNKVLKQRNALLKSINPKNPTEMQGLDIWDEQLASLGTEIINRRIYFCEELNKLVPKVHKILAPDETVSLNYETNIQHTGALSKDSFLSALHAMRQNDLRLKTTTVGAHRDDILLLLNGKDARSYASQGQQRTLALSLKIAELKIFEAALNEKPILLLDDVFSELDKSRQNRLIKLISGWQTIITATEFSPSDFAPAKVFPMKH